MALKTKNSYTKKLIPVCLLFLVTSCSPEDSWASTSAPQIDSSTTISNTSYEISSTTISHATSEIDIDNLPDGFFYFDENSVDKINELSLQPDCKGIAFDSNLVLEVDKAITIRKDQIIYGNNAQIKRKENFKGKMISLYENVEFFGLTIDGSDIKDGEWDKTIDLATSSDCHIHDCSFANSNETIVVYGESVTIEYCTIENANGNGIHLSGCSNTIIKNNSIKNTNLSESYTNGQCGIYVCQDVYDTLIENNQINNAKNGIGRLDSIKDQNITIKNNLISNSIEYGIHGIYHSNVEDESSKNINILNNTIVNSKYVAFRNNANNSIKSDMSLVFSNNTLVNTHLDISSNKNALISNNSFSNCHIELNHVDGIEITSNTIDGDEFGIYGQRTKNANINNNDVKSSKYGICLKTDSSNNSVLNNAVKIVSNLENGVEGIYVGLNSEISFNNLELNVGTGIICDDNSIISSNTIIGTEKDIIAIRVYGGSSNITVKNNRTNSKGSFALSQGTNCHYEDNIQEMEN